MTKMKHTHTFWIALIVSLVLILYLNPIKYFDPANRFERAWNNNDSAFIKIYISKLKERNVEEVGAISENILAEVTGFPYGMMLYRKEYWDTIPPLRKKFIKLNIIMVWDVYVRSELFMKKGCKEALKKNNRSKFLCEKYNPVRNRNFTNAELKEIKGIVDEIAKNCP